jgi:hypothetical protein
MAERILQHGFKLKRIFFEDPYQGPGPVTVAKQVFHLENKAHRLAEDYCNKPLPEGYVEKAEASILKSLDRILGYKKAGIPVFVNLDPRGYALKVDDAYMRSKNLDLPRDMGGYGLLAPDFRGE